MPTLHDEAAAELAALREADARHKLHYLGEPAVPPPIHTVYVSADHYGPGAIDRLHGEARIALERHGATPAAFAHAIGLPGFEARPMPAAEATMTERYASDPDGLRADAPHAWLAHRVHERTRARIHGHAVADVRIDFEDGYGDRPDREEDADAQRTAAAVAAQAVAGVLPRRIGIRIEPLDGRNVDRAVRTLELFVDALVEASGGALPAELVVTLPKVTHAAQTSTAAALLARLERRHGLPERRLQLEIMVEVTQALFDPDGRCRLLSIVEAAGGRCIGAALGVYDFTASCQLAAGQQVPDHPLCDFARALMRATLGGAGVGLSDGATNVLPIEPHEGDPSRLSEVQRRENEAAVHRAWRLSLRHVTHALRQGFWQGWDMHGAQLPARYAAHHAFHLTGFDVVAARLAAILSRLEAAQVVSADALDDAATAQALLGQVTRAYDAGAIDEKELGRAGLRPAEASIRTFSELAARRRGKASPPRR
jgi:citrate lyase beta subunit